MGAISNVAVVAITFLPVNRPPVGSVPPLLTLQDIELVSYIIAADLDNDTITAYITSLPDKGMLRQYNGTNITTVPTILSDPLLRFRFAPAYLQSGNPYANFSFYLFDQTNYSNTVVAPIVVTPVNYPPVAINSTIVFPQDTTANFTLQATDIETPNLISATILTLPPTSSGVLTDSLGNALTIGQISTSRIVLFVPFPLWFGVVSFQFGANDGTQNSTNVATVTLNITHVNHVPTTTVSFGTAVRTVSLPISISAYDLDIGDNITVTISNYASAGNFYTASGALFTAAPFNLPILTIPTARVITTTITFTAPLTAAGSNYANLSYFLMDQTGAKSNTTNISINIEDNRAPVALTLANISVNQDFVSSSISLNGTDADVADSSILQVIITTLPSKGVLYLPNGTAISSPSVISTNSKAVVTYQTYQRGSDQFIYQVKDPLNALSLPVAVVLVINNTNHAPVASWVGGCIGDEDTVLTISQMSAVDPDADDTALSFFIASPPSKGILAQVNGSTCSSYPCLVTSSSNVMLFIPETNGNGVPYTSFIFYVVDSHGLRSPNVTGSISVNPVDDPPVIYNSMAMGNESSNITVALNVTDVDTPLSQINITIVSVPPTSLGVLVDQQGSVITAGSIVPNQTFKFVPVQYANGNSTIVFRASDALSTTGTATCFLIVVPVTQAPICSTNLPNPIIVPKQSSTTVGLTTWDPDNGETYTYYLLSYQAADGTGVLTGPTGIITNTSNIIAAAPSSTSFITTVQITYNVTFIVTSLNISFIVNDGTYNSSICYVNLVVQPNLPPVAIPPSLTTTLESTMSTSIVLNGTDSDDDWRTARINIASLPLKGQLFVNSSFSIQSPSLLDAGVFAVTYLPMDLFYGNDNFTFVVTDRSGMHSSVQSATITVIHVNHAPTISIGPLSTLEDVPMNITTANVNDIDVGDVLTLVIATPPSIGSFSMLDGAPITTYPANITSPFAFTYNPVPYANGPVSFSLYATDGMNVSNTIVASIQVIAVNNAPTAQSSTLSLLENSPAAIVTLAAADVDNTQTELSAYIVSLPLPSLGSVTYANGTSVSYGDRVPYPRNLTFTPALYAYGVGAIVFVAWDGALLSSPGFINITVTHVNHAPTTSATSAVVATRMVELPIPIITKDVDTGDYIVVILSSFVGGGQLSNSSGGAALTNNSVLLSGSIQVIIFFYFISFIIFIFCYNIYV